MIRPLALCLLGTMALASCADPGGNAPRLVSLAAEQPTPSSRCEALIPTRLAGDQVALVAAYESTAAEISAWMESGRIPGGGRAGAGQAPTRSFPPTESIAACYFDGTFSYRGTLPPGASPPRFERMLLLLDAAGKVIGEFGGTRLLYPLVRPA